ncbi:MAG: 30S ribosomal protein S17 [candidate division Zixibacteria bacterium]|jgi:small subunit ribosomal protein S17|nr:30S ribosomal protein S17 [candidate division Zixibacteria bacterium]
MRNKRKTRIGIVKSAKMDKTLVVAVERIFRHSAYGKIVKKTTKFYAHDPEKQAKEGDRVMIAETRPLSKTKRWRLTAVLQKAK